MKGKDYQTGLDKSKTQQVVFKKHTEALKYKPLDRLTVKDWKKLCPCKHSQKKAQVTISMSDKIYFRTSNKTRNTEENLMRVN